MRFLIGARIRVTDRSHHHYGQHGHVDAVRLVDDGAFVSLDDGPRVLLYPHQCGSLVTTDSGRTA